MEVENYTVLITTIVTSTVTIVAIIGGFLVSRLVAISSSKNGIIASINELIHKKKNLNKSINELEKETLFRDYISFSEEAGVQLFFNSKTFEALVEDENVNYNYRSLEELQLVHDFIIKLREKSRNVNLFIDFDKLCNELKIEANDRWCFKDIYEIVTEGIEREFRNDDPKWYVRSSTYLKTRGELQDELDKYIKERDLVLALIKEKRKSVSEVGRPKGILSGALFIISSILLGVATPVYMLPMGTNYINNSHWTILLSTFTLILLFFISYIVYLITDLDNTWKRKP